MLLNAIFCGIILLSIVCYDVTAQDNVVKNSFTDWIIVNSTKFRFSSEETDPCSTANCECVPYHRCDANDTLFRDHTEEEIHPISINLRPFPSPCSEYLDVCCLISSMREDGESSGKNDISGSNKSITIKTNTSSNGGFARNLCGIRNINGIDFKLRNNEYLGNEAEYGEFPWLTVILRNNYNPDMDTRFVGCGGSIITPLVIITAAHCVANDKPSDIRIRAGEWDIKTDRERLPYQERYVKNIIIHPEFNKYYVINDIALLVLESELQNAEHLGTVCLPPQDIKFNASDCFAMGWGRNLYNEIFGRYGNNRAILKKQQLSIVPFDVCKKAQKTTRLGNKFNLDRSFMCAGGVNDEDMCTSDSGGPLVCPDPQNSSRYMLAGIVSWSIGCNTVNIPGVYVDVAQYRTWVDQQMSILKLDSVPYEI